MMDFKKDIKRGTCKPNYQLPLQVSHANLNQSPNIWGLSYLRGL